VRKGANQQNSMAQVYEAGDVDVLAK
jgi:hypothetical protein